MRDKDVKGWVSGYSGSANEDPYDTDDDFSPSRSGRGAHEELPDPDENWDGFLAHAEKVVGASGTKARIGILQHRLKSVAKRSDLDQTRRVELLALLLPTYARYTDSASRVAALEVGAELLRADEEASGNSADEKRGMGAVMKHGVGWLRKEAERICKQGAHGSVGTLSSCCFRRALNIHYSPALKTVAHPPLCLCALLCYHGFALSSR